jgi:hypothetical protein
MPVLHNEVIGDLLAPNTVSGAPMAGGEGLNWVLGLSGFNSTQVNPEGVHGVARFLAPADHSSLLSPVASPAATAEMQGQMVSFIASGGQLVNVGNPDVLQPATPAEQDTSNNASADLSGQTASGGSSADPVVNVVNLRGYDND